LTGETEVDFAGDEADMGVGISRPSVVMGGKKIVKW